MSERTYIIKSGKSVTSANDYGKAVVKAHTLGEGTRILSVDANLRSKCVKVVRFPYPNA